MTSVKVIQKSNMVEFKFNDQCDAFEFAETCMECGNDGTEIIISEDKEDK